MKKIRCRLIIVEPVTGLNLGMIARLIKNFSVDELFIVNPKLSHIEWRNAYKFSSHAQDVLDKAHIYKKFEDALKDSELIIATSAIYRLKGGNILRRPITLHELKEIILNRGITQVSIVLGRETTGLTNEEISKCDILLTIETNKDYPTLNITHATAIILYYLYTNVLGKKIIRKAAPPEIKKKILETINFIIDNVIHDERFKRLTYISFKNILNRGMPDYREAGLLLKLFKAIQDSLQNKEFS